MRRPAPYLFDLAEQTRERLHTVEHAAELLGLDPAKLAHAVQTGVVRSHTGRGPYPLLRLADVLAAIDCSPTGRWR